MPYNFTVKRGDSWSGLTVNVTENDEPMDLTSASIKCQVKKSACESTAVLEFDTEDDSITITLPLSGQFTVNPLVFDIPARNYVYDIQITKGNGNIITVLEGEISVLNDITR